MARHYNSFEFIGNINFNKVKKMLETHDSGEKKNWELKIPQMVQMPINTIFQWGDGMKKFL